jgi:hypothetical protein
MIRTISWTGAMLLFLNSPAFAAHPLITDDAGTLGRSVFQMELNTEYGHDDENGVEDKATEIAAALAYGATDRIDIVLGVPYQTLRDEVNGETYLREDGVADLSLEVKWQLFARDACSFALKPGVSLPIGDEDKGLGSGELGGTLFLISTYESGPLAFHANLGYLRNNNNTGDEEDLWHTSVATQYTLNDRVTIVANTGFERNPAPEADDYPAFLLAGLIVALTEYVEVDFGVKTGLTDPETDTAVLAGIAWRW